MVNFIIGLATILCLFFMVIVFIYLCYISISALKFIVNCFLLLILVFGLFICCCQIYEIGESVKTIIKGKLNRR